MKVNIKGLVFTGFAAAILSANAMALGENTVTSKSFTEATYQHKSTGASIGNSTGGWTPLDATIPTENASESAAPTTAAVRAALNAVDSARTYLEGSNISIDTTNHISADTGAITDTATTLVDGATVYAALANEQDKNTVNKYEVNKNGVWMDIGSAVSGSGNVTVEADSTTGALTIGATTDTAATQSSTHLITSGAVYDAIQDATGGTVIPTMDTSICDSTHPCALVNDSTGLHWRTMATATDTTGGACGDVGGCGA